MSIWPALMLFSVSISPEASSAGQRHDRLAVNLLNERFQPPDSEPLDLLGQLTGIVELLFAGVPALAVAMAVAVGGLGRCRAVGLCRRFGPSAGGLVPPTWCRASSSWTACRQAVSALRTR